MESKPFYQSKTLIGALALLVSLIARFFGKEIAVDDPQVEQFLEAFLGVIGLGLVIWGRFTATTKLSGPPPKDLGLFLLICIAAAGWLLTGCEAYNVSGSLSHTRDGKTITLTKDGKNIDVNLDVHDSKSIVPLGR